ncbi:carbon-monoxide dehydrogenase medium subunit [Tistlia consotensis]|uniref:Carbon-monoxide dehydrogenase medium subunit n=1 Tax=Tistlia consotensis USBA 355 TaxID=560819 RepID=A0A1Y6CLU4_9PROT|nr:FAD binding domain-containing protein [Tistlia consotensis]SMF58673.1 carbon-monoxide dehydrogenase medium subunit [Tistlia consotensis USBA 355]SNR63586.1 carbon-monoxide dehydrogenase medium subunit [Tistlia consotensis]
MKPAAFDYLAVESVEAALEALARAGGEAKIVAGGQSLVPMLNFRLLQPALLVDINRIPGLDFIAVEPARIRVGALTRHHRQETAPELREHLPVLSAAMAEVAHLAIRNRGTLGGSLSHADPAAELPMMALLLDAEIATASPSGGRRIAARDFFLGPLATGLAEDELLIEVAFARPAAGSGWAFEEVARRSGDFALAAAAVTLRLQDGRIAEPHVALTGVDETPLRAGAAEALLDGEAPGAELFAAAAEAVRRRVQPNTDLHASADYRRHLAGVLVRRTLEKAAAQAAGGRA